MRDNGLKKTQCFILMWWEKQPHGRWNSKVYLKVYGLETINIIDIGIEFKIGEAFFITKFNSYLSMNQM